jgi:putative tryptophan/tyrosine transport system substrate-binding protein
VKRREVMALLAAAAAAWPLAGRAQQSDRVRRIGVLQTAAESDPQAKSWVTAFDQRLQQLGWEQGRNLRIDYRWSGGDEQRLGTYAAELVGVAADVLFAAGTPALVALNRETRSLPIVFVQVADPVKLGFVASLARPGGNMTGFTTYEYSIGGKWLELLKDTAPGTARVAGIFDPTNLAHAEYVRALEASAPSFNMQVTRVAMRDAVEIERAIEAFAQQANGAVVVLPSGITLVHRDLIISLANRHRLPAIYPYRFFAAAGGFMSYGTDLPDTYRRAASYPDTYRRAASYVDLILNGANPGQLPVQLSAKFELVVNLKTAKALGLTIPEPFLQRADEVIE